MKKLAIVVLLVVSACRRQAVVTSTPTQSAPPAASTADGGATPREALQKFFAAAKAQDIQAMSGLWGTRNGPARSDRTNMTFEVMEQRLVYMAKCLRHDSYAIKGETPIVGGERQFNAELRYRNALASDEFVITQVQTTGRWLVRTFDVSKLNAICTAQ